MTQVERNVADAIAQWAAQNPEIRRVWLFHHRAESTPRSNNPIDVALELEPIGDSEETLTRWMACSKLWESQLQSRVDPSIALSWRDPDRRMGAEEAHANTAKVLLYERAA
jgi:hypothetical protein